MQNTKNFWEKPEGTTGMIALSIGIIAGGFGLFKILPFLIVLLQNTLYATALFGALFAVFWLVTNKRFRTLVKYGFQSLMRFITGIFITIDPIGILENYIVSLKESRAKMQMQIDRLRGEIESLKREIEINTKNMAASLNLAREARERGLNTALALQGRRAQRLRKSNTSLGDLLASMERMMQLLVKLRKVSDVVIDDTEHQVDVAKREYKATKAGYSAMRSARRILEGGGDEKELYDQTMEHVINKVALQAGEIESFMDLSEDFIVGVDLQNAVDESEAMKLLERWEKDPEYILNLGDTIPQGQIADLESLIDDDTFSAEGSEKSIGREGRFTRLID